MSGLTDLPMTDSGHVRKRDAMQWLSDVPAPTEDSLKKAVIPKPSHFSGSKYATDISGVRVTGDPDFVEAVARRLKPLQDFENDTTRIELNLQRTEDKETGELTDNFALYISVAERG